MLLVVLVYALVCTLIGWPLILICSAIIAGSLIRQVMRRSRSTGKRCIPWPAGVEISNHPPTATTTALNGRGDASDGLSDVPAGQTGGAIHPGEPEAPEARAARMV